MLNTDKNKRETNMKINSFKEAIASVYVENPCGTQPNALWKTLGQIGNFHSEYVIENDEVKSLRLWNDTMLHTYWHRNSKCIELDAKYLNSLKVAILHETQLSRDLRDKFSTIKPYFRLMHGCKDVMDIDIPWGYYLRNVDFNRELQLVSDLICSCYRDIKPSVEEVLNWTRHPVFNKDLWIWIIDKNTEKPVALGIAELDMNIKEGSLEWIQVLPEHQGKRLGKVLVTELLNRMKPYADFTTVSGETDNRTNPERLYRSCGFYGDDVWYVLSR